MSEAKNLMKGKTKNSRKNNFYKKNKRKDNRRPKEIEMNVDEKDLNKADLNQGNDKAWYNHFPDQVKATAHPSFAEPTGAIVSSPFYNSAVSTTITPTKSIPGIMVLNYVPTIGRVSGLTTDFVNVALNRIQVFLRRNLSSTSNYDAADIGYYLIVMDSIYQLFQSCCRAYGFMQNPKVYNRYMQYALVSAMGFNPQDLADNMADYRGRLNYLAHTLQQFCVPSGLDFISRHVWMCSEVFTDAESVKAQLYLYKVAGYFKLVEATGSTQPAYLSYNEIKPSSDPLTFGDWLDYLWDAVKALMDSQDMIQISGDLLKAYGANNLFVVQPIGEDYILEPYFSKEVLSQMENAMPLGKVDPTSANITQNTSLSGGPNLTQDIKFPIITNSGNFRAALDEIGSGSIMLNMHMDDVDDLDVMVATRLMYPFSIDGDGTTGNEYVIVPWAFGTEIITECNIYSYVAGQIPGANPASNVFTYSLNTQVSQSNWEAVQAGAIWATFDWAPRLVFIIPGATNGYSIAELLDVDNYAMVEENFLNGVHRTAVTSLWDTSELIDRLSKSPVNK